MSVKTCPECGFIAHALCSSGNQWKYVCERCGTIFIDD